ncbi:ARF GTPase-activating protein GIT2 isoform X2 [Macrosteles quadrilineatus]|uniref:ARF GTPase-activating protein GIT2 isoform X2 n=1 Tax=Macrosteles quadrilineatus TaxID=74068 RepID=UPI0023E2D6A9|nr:ARF GTPase-activating protein GIT2 isoform X2 [Macrosteles quadrilineatus]
MSGKLGIRSSTDVCADCGEIDPQWAVVNRGLLICDLCCSIHRSLGRHVSQIKHLKKSAWSPSLLAMVQALNNSNINTLWEHTLCDPKSPKKKPHTRDALHPTKADFIRAKHQLSSYVLRSSDTEEELNQQLHSSVRTGNLETSLRLLAQGADPNYYHEEKGTRPIHVAARAGQIGQVELLVSHGADPGALDMQGNTPSACARLSGYRDVSQRLIELLYEVPDRLTYFLCRRRPDHASGQHFLVPEIADCLEAPQLTKEARAKLQQLSNSLFEDLAMDVYDEVDRREIEAIWLSNPTCAEHNSVPFLPVNPELSTMRNQGRQKLARFSQREFASLVIDILTDAKRRQSPTDRLSLLRNLTKDVSDDEPLYDSVASDEDYASAEQIAALVAANLKGPEKAEPVNSAPPPAPAAEVKTPSAAEEELRSRLTASQLRIVQLAAEVQRLNLKVEEMTKENQELKTAVQHNSMAVTSDPETEPVSLPQRPVSMYETRDCLRTQTALMPQSEEVVRRTDQVTKRLQELWSTMQSKHALVPCAERIRVAVAELTAIFPQQGDEIVRSALRQLNTSTVRLQAECAGLENSAERVRSCAYNMAKATRQLLTRFQ